MIINRDYEERYYSDYDDELDSIYERAFSEGYEYAQREFAKYGKRAARAFFTPARTKEGQVAVKQSKHNWQRGHSYYIEDDMGAVDSYFKFPTLFSADINPAKSGKEAVDRVNLREGRRRINHDFGYIIDPKEINGKVNYNSKRVTANSNLRKEGESSFVEKTISENNERWLKNKKNPESFDVRLSYDPNSTRGWVYSSR